MHGSSVADATQNYRHKHGVRHDPFSPMRVGHLSLVKLARVLHCIITMYTNTHAHRQRVDIMYNGGPDRKETNTPTKLNGPHTYTHRHTPEITSHFTVLQPEQTPRIRVVLQVNASVSFYPSCVRSAFTRSYSFAHECCVKREFPTKVDVHTHACVCVCVQYTHTQTYTQSTHTYIHQNPENITANKHGWGAKRSSTAAYDATFVMLNT